MIELQLINDAAYAELRYTALFAQWAYPNCRESQQA